MLPTRMRYFILPTLFAGLVFLDGHAESLQLSAPDKSGKVESLVIETGRSGKSFSLAGRNAGQQLVVTGRYSSGALRDLTHHVKYEAVPAGIVSIDGAGYVTALMEGRATLHVNGPGDLKASIEVGVTDIVRDVPVSFANEIVPVFTKFGCNSGGCHGKSGGQNGFQLSLLGFEPAEDYEFLVKEARGQRRLLASAPEYSLFMRKASGTMAHGGGAKIRTDSPYYHLLKRWIEQGMPYGKADDPTVSRIEVLPSDRVMERKASQQLTVVAHYSDGSSKDVTRLAQFEPNDADMAEVSETGLVATKELTGTVAIMARYQANVAVFRATMPQGVAVTKLPPSSNFIDDHVFQHLKKLGLPPSDVCSDATFIRRVTIDIAGRLPTLEETQQFLADRSANKRVVLVDRLLASTDYADYFAGKWSAVLRNKRQSPKDDTKPTFAFHTWIRESLHANKHYDQFVREILTATGEEVQNPPVAWYREVKDLSAQVEDTAQLFLGTRIGCARCHHHPLEKWSQEDYYGFAAFFSQVDYKVPPKPEKGKKQPKNAPKPPTHVILKEGKAQATNPRTGLAVKPTVLGGKASEVPADLDPRLRLAEWMASKENPYFARALVNRYWKHFFGRGLVDPEDDLRVTNPPTNPALLDALARHFIDGKFDLKNLVRTICTSTAYQLSAEPNEFNRSDKQNFSRFVPRRLNAEVLFDAIDQVTLAKSEFPGVPAGTRAVQLPDNAFESYFLSVFGRPDMSSACECERSTEVGLSQMLHLMNSHEVLSKVSGTQPKDVRTGKSLPPAKGPAAAFKVKTTPGERVPNFVLKKDKRSHEEKIRELYLVALSREPTPAETKLLLGHIGRNEANIRAAYEDIVWVLINSEDFLFNR